MWFAALPLTGLLDFDPRAGCGLRSYQREGDRLDVVGDTRDVL
jgi:hypothetical protein